MEADIGMEACMNKSVCVGSVRPPVMNNMRPCQKKLKQSKVVSVAINVTYSVSAFQSYMEEIKKPHDKKVEFGKLHSVIFYKILE